MYFIEHLTAVTWLFSVVPLLWKERRGNARGGICYYWDASRTGLVLARIMTRYFGISLQLYVYKIQNVRSRKGVSAFLQVMWLDSIELQRNIKTNPLFASYISKMAEKPRFPLYLEKSLISYDMQNIGSYDHFLNLLLLIRAAAWKVAQMDAGIRTAYLFARRRVWFSAFQQDAIEHNLILIALPARMKINYKNIARSIIPARLLNYLHYMLANRSFPRNNNEVYATGGAKPRIATEYYGHLNLDKPERYSDLFFLQNSSLKGQDILMMFNLPSDPLDAAKLEELKRHGVQPVALSPGATKLAYSTVYGSGLSRNVRATRSLSAEINWMNKIQADYDSWRSYWTAFFDRFNIRIYTSWLKYDTNHLAIADAMDAVGGITTIYQRSYQVAPIPSTTISVDIEFGFSPATALMESMNGSRISYYVTTGYFGDHRFFLLRDQAKRIRDSLIKNGADHVMAYFDENTVDDPRWYLDHDYAKQNYSFLLQKVLEDKTFGLVLKPKNPGSLLRRLGSVAKLMEEARATGRCHISLDGVIQGSIPPALAALVADVAVHDGITSPTAGMESAFCGTPTLLLDNEGWPVSNLYALGEGKVVFNNWEVLWSAYREYLTSQNRVPGFGDWSPVLEEIDPFRDGQGAQRIGTYLKWLLDGLRSGLNKETVMADAAERYRKEWGKDKVSSIVPTYGSTRITRSQGQIS